VLDYDKDKGGYMVAFSQTELEEAPAYELDDLTSKDGDFDMMRQKSYAYYEVDRDW